MSQFLGWVLILLLAIVIMAGHGFAKYLGKKQTKKYSLYH